MMNLFGKKKKWHARQGDVLIIEDNDANLEGLKPVPTENGDVVLAHGEVTGHAHRIKNGQGTALYDDPTTGFGVQERVLHARQVSDKAGEFLAKLEHEEHGTVELPTDQGTFRVYRQTEYVRQRPPRVVAD